MTDTWVERYRKEALPKLREALRPSSVLLFGSRAAGTARTESDLDVIIVAEAFAGIPFVRMAYVLGLVHFPLESDIGATKDTKLTDPEGCGSVSLDFVAFNLGIAVPEAP